MKYHFWLKILSKLLGTILVTLVFPWGLSNWPMVALKTIVPGKMIKPLFIKTTIYNFFYFSKNRFKVLGIMGGNCLVGEFLHHWIISHKFRLPICRPQQGSQGGQYLHPYYNGTWIGLKRKFLEFSSRIIAELIIHLTLIWGLIC